MLNHPMSSVTCSFCWNTEDTEFLYLHRGWGVLRMARTDGEILEMSLCPRCLNKAQQALNTEVCRRPLTAGNLLYHSCVTCGHVMALHDNSLGCIACLLLSRNLTDGA